MPAPDLSCRLATIKDARLLARLNHQLIADEGHRNPMTVAQLEERMTGWLDAGRYTGVLFTDGPGVVGAYALFREDADEIYLRHLFVARNLRRQGWGRGAIGLLRAAFLTPGKRLMVVALCGNAPAIAFWHSMGFADYSLTLECLPGP